MIRAADYSDALFVNQIGQERVMSYYLGLPIDLNRLHVSPLRKDTNPTCSFYYNSRGVLKFHDFGTSEQFSAVEVVMKRYKINYGDALRKIKQDASAIKNMEFDLSLREENVDYVCVAYTHPDWSYWKRYDINASILKKFGVTHLSKVFRNDKIFLKSTPDNPVFAYNFSSGNIKIYRPLSKDKKKKWYGNSNMYDIGGYEVLPDKGKLVFITSSLKDLMVLYTFGFPGVCLNGEGYGTFGPSKEVFSSLLKDLRRKFEHVLLFLDSDESGIKFAEKLSATHSVRYIHLKENGPKDISDLRYASSRKHTWKVLKKLIKNKFNASKT